MSSVGKGEKDDMAYFSTLLACFAFVFGRSRRGLSSGCCAASRTHRVPSQSRESLLLLCTRIFTTAIVKRPTMSRLATSDTRKSRRKRKTYDINTDTQTGLFSIKFWLWNFRGEIHEKRCFFHWCVVSFLLLMFYLESTTENRATCFSLIGSLSRNSDRTTVVLVMKITIFFYKVSLSIRRTRFLF